MNENDLAKLIADLFNSRAAEPRPAGGEFDYLRFRFRNGSVQLSARPCDEADVTRRGGYALYAVKTTIVPLGVPVGPMTYWAPSVFFVPDDEAMRPEVAYDGSPFRRGVKAVKFEGHPVSPETMKRVFDHLELPKSLLAEHGRRTGRRWEVLAEQERRRCAAAGVPCTVFELPDDMRSIS